MNEKKEKRIKISAIYMIFIVVVIILFALVLLSSFATGRGINTMQDTTEEYIACHDAIDTMREASDFLTEHSRVFVVSGDVRESDAYMKEVLVDKRRDQSIEVLKEYSIDVSVTKSLEQALVNSNKLAEVEMYAMHLAAIGHDVSDKELGAELSAVKISSDDLKLSKAEQVAKATEMMFNDNYDVLKQSILTDVFVSLEELVKDTRNQQVGSYNRASFQSVQEKVLLIIMLAATFVIMIITAFLIILPLNRSLSYIKNHEMLPVRGSAEYSYLAEAYNKMLERSRLHQEKLSYEASHDQLTGLYNRKMYDETMQSFAEEEISLILVDVDYFKGVNDTYGHDVGDRVLKKVAGILLENFRHEDYVCRIGGDEFAVLMRHANEEVAQVIERKILEVRELLKIEDDLPMVTLSIGVAFGTGMDAEGIYQRADKALYQTKRNGRNGWSFYEE